MPDIPAVVRRCRTSRTHRRVGGAAPIRGFLPRVPRVGAPLIFYMPDSDGNLARLITSCIERVLMDPQGQELFVETRQSVYHVILDQPAPVVAASPRPRASFDGFEITVAPDSPCDIADEIDTTD
jgi:hypothetical protein